MGHLPEKRRFVREPLSAPIWLIQDEQQLVMRAQTDNLSYGGAHLLLDDASLVKVGDDVRVRMVVPDSFGETESFCSVDSPAKVAWMRSFADSDSGQVHMGLAFKSPIPIPLLTAAGAMQP